MYRTRHLAPRVRRLLNQLSLDERARLDGLEVRASGFGEWLEAGGELLPESADGHATAQHLHLVEDRRRQG